MVNHLLLLRIGATSSSREGTKKSEKRKGEKINLDTFKSISRFMFNNDAWLSDCRIRGKFPDWKVEKDGQQIAVWSTKRVLFQFQGWFVRDV